MDLAKRLEEYLEIGDLQQASSTLFELKRMMVTMPLLPLVGPSDPQASDNVSLFRQVYELAVFLSVEQKDLASFDRHMAFLQSFYQDYATTLKPSPRQWELTGLHLLALLAANKISDFHTQLELIPVTQLDNPFIRFSIRLEQELMEGSYSQLWTAASQVPSKYYRFFIETLVGTVRETILDCCKTSYDTFTLGDAKELLNVSSEQEAASLCTSHGCKIKGNLITFPNSEKPSLSIPSKELAAQVLSYAAELERIV